MRFVDTRELHSLGRDGGGPWRIGEDKLLRTLSGQRPIPTEDDAESMLEVYRATAAAGAGTPDGLEVVGIEGGYGVVVEYVVGVNIGTHIAIGSYTPAEVGEEMARLLHVLHACSLHTGRDYNALFRRYARNIEPLLPEGIGEKLVELIDAVPESSSLLHGDMHVGNVVVCNGVPALIDLESVGFGNPIFDLSIARSRGLHNCANEAERLGIETEYALRLATTMWDSLLASYFADVSAGQLELLDRSITVLSEVEFSCFGNGIKAGIELNESQRERLEECTEVLKELLPQLDTLVV